MAVTFSNAQFSEAQASQGAIALGLYVGTNLTGALGATAVTVNGTINAPGDHVLIDLNVAGLVTVGANSTYLGYARLGSQHYEYLFSVQVAGLATPVTIGVSGTDLPTLRVSLGVLSDSPPTDATLPSDGVPPLFQSASVNGNTLTLTYGEILDAAHPPAAGAFAVTAGGSAATVNGVAVSGSTVVLTLAAPVASGQAVTVAYTDPSGSNDTLAIQDRAGNDAATLTARTVVNATPDTAAPLFQSASVNGNTLTLTYNEALDAAHPPAAGAFAVTAGGSAATVNGVAVSGSTVVLTLGAPVASGQTVTVAYADPTPGVDDVLAVQDAAGNDAATLAAATVTNATPDTTAPVFQSASVNANTLTLTYSEALDATNRPTAASFAVTAGGATATVSGVAVSGNSVVLTLGAPVASGQTVTVAYRDPSGLNDPLAIQDIAGNDAATLGQTTVTNATPDTTAPVFQSASVNGNTLTLTYGEALDATNRPTAASFAVTAGGAAATVNGVAVSGNNVVLTLAAPVASGQAVTVAYADPGAGNDLLAIQDATGNDAASLGPTVVNNATPDATPPVFQSAGVNGATLTLTYGEALDAANPPTASAFTVTAGGTLAGVNAVAVSGNTVVLTLAAPVASGQAVTVAYADPTPGVNDSLAIQDVAGNDAASLGAAVALNTTPDTVPPLFQSASVNGATLTLNYSEMLDAGAAPGPGAFTVSAGGVPVAVTAAAVSGSSVTLTLGTPVASGQAVTVSYADLTTGNDAVAVQDMAGNDAVSLAAVAVVNATPLAADTVPPAFQSAAVNGAVLTLTYGEAIDAANLPDAGAFTVAAGGAPVTVAGVAAVGSTVVLTLSAPVASGQAVTVAYADPTTGNDPRAVQDLAGNDAVGLGPTAVANTTPDATAPVFQAAAANGATLTLTYGEALDAANPPTAGRFAVTADGAPVAVTGVAVTGNTVALTLGTPVGNGQAVTVAYLDPTLGDDAAAVQDLAGNDAVSLAATVALNTTPDTTPPAFRSASVDGTTLTLTYGEIVDAAHLPASTAFTVTADGVARAVTGVAAAGSTVTLTLGTPVGSGQAVTVAYADLTTGNDALAVQDLAGNDAASLAATAVVNATPVPADAVPPVFQSATVNGAVLTLTYGEVLDAANPPAARAFAVTAGGVPVTVSSVAVSGNSVALTLGTPVANGQAVTVAYADDPAVNNTLAIQDLAGNDALALAPTVALNTTADATPPAFQTASVDGATLTLTYGEALDAANPPAAGAFTVTVGGAPVVVSAVAVAGNSVALTLGTAVASGQAVTVAYADDPAVNNISAIQDRAGNDALTLAATTVINATAVPADTVAPVFLSGSVDAATVTLAFGETLDAGNPPPAGAFTVTAGGAPVGVTGATVSGNSVVLTLGAPVASGQPVTVSYADPGVGNDTLAIQDVAGNDAASLGATAIVNATPVPADTTPPALASAAVDGATLVLAYGEALDAANPPAAGAFTVLADGNRVAVSTVAVTGNTVALALGTAVTSGQVVTVSYDDPSTGNDTQAIQDIAGNDAAGFTAEPVINGTPAAVDTLPPALVSGSADAGTLTLTYSEALDGANPPPTTAFAVTAGGAAVGVSAVAVTGNSVKLTLGTAVASGQAVTVSYADDPAVNDIAAIQDLVGNDAAGFGATVVVNATPTPRDTLPPTLQSGAVNADAVTLTFSEALDGANPPATTAFAVTAGGAPVTVSNVAVTGNTVALTLGTAVGNGQAVTVAYADDPAVNDIAAIQDLAGNDAAGFAANLVNTTPVPADTVPPALQAAAVDGRTLTLTYGEALDGAHPPATTAFAVTADGASVTVSNVAVSGNSVALTLGTAVGNGQAVTVSYADDPGVDNTLAIQDLSGNDAAALVAAPVLNATPDTSAPVFRSATVNGTALTLGYDEALDPANPPATTAFTVTAGGAPVTVSNVAVTGNSVKLTLATAVASGAAVTVTYADDPAVNNASAIQDAAGNDAASLAATPVLNATPDTTAPAFQSGSVSAGTVTLTYGETLDATNPPDPRAFAVTADGAPVTVSSVAVVGNTVALTLGTAVGNGQAVTVSYADDPAVNNAAAIQDLAGNDAASLAAIPLVNATPDTRAPVFQSGSVDGRTLTLTYGESLDAANLPAGGAFTVLADGAPVTVSNVAVTGNSVKLTLGTAVASGQAVTVAYADDPGVDNTLAIQDLAGNDAASLAATVVVNATPDTTGPAFQTASVNGGTVTLTYGEALDSTNPPDPRAFAVTADGAPVTVSNVAVTGNTVALTLGAPVASGAAVLVSYRDPTGGDDTLAIQDLAGNDAADLGPLPVANATPAPRDTAAPVFQSGSVSAGTVTLTYGETLDATNLPDPRAFAVAADGAPVTVSSVAVVGNTVALTLGTAVGNGQAVTVSYADNPAVNDTAAIQDLAGNDAASLAAIPLVNATPDTTPPVLRTGSVDGTALTLTYSEALDPTSAPAAGAFTVTVDGVSATVGQVAISGNTVSLALATPVADGQAVTVAYADAVAGGSGAVQDLAGNDALDFGATAVVNATPDRTAPTFQSGSVDGTVVTLNYSEALDAANPPLATAFAVTAGGAAAAVTGSTVTGNTVVLTLGTAVTSGQAVTVTYADNPAVDDPKAIQDLAGNDAASLAGAAIVNATPDRTAPAFQTASVAGSTLTLTYGEVLDAAHPPTAGAFAVTAGGASVAVTGATVAGNSVALTLGTPVTSGQVVTVAYGDPSGANDTFAIQDVAGNDAASLGTTVAVNTTASTADTRAPVFQAAAVDGATLTLTYDETLDAAHAPVAGDFTVAAGGAPGTVSSVSVSGRVVTLTLATPVSSGQAVTVAYADPSGANDVFAIQDAAGNDAASLALTPVGNTTPAGGGGGGGGGGTVDPTQGTPGTGGTGTGTTGTGTAGTGGSGTGTGGGTQSNVPPDTGAPATGGQPGPAQQPTIGTVTGANPPADPAGTGLQTPATVDGTPVNTATPVVSGTASPGSTVTLYDTDGTTVLGTGAADAGTGAYAIASTPLGEGTHVLTTTETVGGREGLPSAPLAIDVDTQGPAIAFDPAVSVLGPFRAILSGTVADPSGVVSVDVRTAGRDVGSAAVSADGTWSIAFRAGRSFVTGIEATAVDAAGNQATAPSSYDMTFAIKGQPYRVTQDSYDPETGGYTGSNYFKRDGGELYHSTFASRPNGAGAYTYTGGSFFDDKAYGRFTDVYDADGTVKFQSQYNDDGTVTTSGQKGGITIPSIPNNTITANGADDRFVFTPRAGQSVITDFQASGEGHDVIAFVGTDLGSLADVLRHTTMQGDDAVIHITPTASVQLAGVTKDEISQAQSAFRFHG